MTNDETRKETEMHRERDLLQYEEILFGLQKMLEYAEQLSTNPTLLDIGTGSGKAAREIQEKKPKFRIFGVDRVEHPDVSNNLAGNFILADASSLINISNESVDAIILVHSIAYAESTEELQKIVKELKRVSKAGAILKGSALHPLAISRVGLKQTTIEIAKELEIAGFVVVLASDMGINHKPTEDVFLAIKAGEADDKEDIEYLLRQIIQDEFISNQ